MLPKERNMYLAITYLVGAIFILPHLITAWCILNSSFSLLPVYIFVGIFAVPLAIHLALLAIIGIIKFFKKKFFKKNFCNNTFSHITNKRAMIFLAAISIGLITSLLVWGYSDLLSKYPPNLMSTVMITLFFIILLPLAILPYIKKFYYEGTHKGESAGLMRYPWGWSIVPQICCLIVATILIYFTPYFMAENIGWAAGGSVFLLLLIIGGIAYASSK